MRKAPRILLFGLIASLFLVLAACGDDDDDDVAAPAAGVAARGHACSARGCDWEGSRAQFLLLGRYPRHRGILQGVNRGLQ